MTDRAIRLAGVAALVFVALILISAFAPGSPPAADASVDKIRSFMVDHRGGILAAQLLGIFATPFAVWFFVTLRELTRGDRTDRTTNMAGTAALLGLTITGVLALVGGAVFAAPLYLNGFTDGTGDDIIRLVYSMQTEVFVATAAGLIVTMLGAHIAIRRSGALPVWVAWIAALAAVLNVVSAFASISAGASGLGFLGLIGFAVFMIVSGIMFVAGKASVSTAATAGV